MKNDDLSECIRIFNDYLKNDLGKLDLIEKLNSLKEEDLRAFFEELKKRFDLWTVRRGFGKTKGEILDLILREKK